MRLFCVLFGYLILCTSVWVLFYFIRIGDTYIIGLPLRFFQYSSVWLPSTLHKCLSFVYFCKLVILYSLNDLPFTLTIKSSFGYQILCTSVRVLFYLYRIGVLNSLIGLPYDYPCILLFRITHYSTQVFEFCFKLN